MPRLRPYSQTAQFPIMYLTTGNYICSSGWDSENKIQLLEMSFLFTYLNCILETNRIKVRVIVYYWRGWSWY